MDTYNCINSTSNAYGSGGYGTCTGQTIGAPNTGVFEKVVSSGAFSVALPLVLAVVVIGLAVFGHRRRSARTRGR